MNKTKWIIGLVLIMLLVVVGFYMVTNKSSADVIRTTVSARGTVVQTTTTGVETVKYSEKIPLSGSDWVSYRVVTTTAPKTNTTIPTTTPMLNTSTTRVNKNN